MVALPRVVPLKLRTEAGVLSMFSTTTVFGTAVEVTLSELVLESLVARKKIARSDAGTYGRAVEEKRRRPYQD